MKTTIDLPDELLHRAKIVAAQRRTTLKELVVEGLQHVMEPPQNEAALIESLISSFATSKNTESVGPFNRDELYDRQALR